MLRFRQALASNVPRLAPAWPGWATVPAGEQAGCGEAEQDAGRCSRRLAAEHRDDDADGGETPHAVGDRRAAEPREVLFALQNAEQHLQP